MAKIHFTHVYGEYKILLPIHENTGINLKFKTQEELLLLMKNNVYPQDICKKCLNGLHTFFKYPYDDFKEILKEISEITALQQLKGDE